MNVKNPKKPKKQFPAIFIASSVKGLEVAYDIQENFEGDGIDSTVWKQGAFEPSEGILDQIVSAAKTSDFGVFVFIPDDAARINKRNVSIVRDNVLFELGLFIGSLGAERCFIVLPEESKNRLRIPSDLAGVGYITYRASRDNRLAALGPACNKIRKAVKKKGLFLKQTKLIKRRPAPLTKGRVSVSKLPKRVVG